MTVYRAEDAPKDGTSILGDFGWPWWTPCAWCARSGKWAVTNIQAEEFGGDCWWETDVDGELRGWVPMPKMPREYEPVAYVPE